MRSNSSMNLYTPGVGAEWWLWWWEGAWLLLSPVQVLSAGPVGGQQDWESPGRVRRPEPACETSQRCPVEIFTDISHL